MEQPAIDLFSELGWETANCFHERFRSLRARRSRSSTAGGARDVALIDADELRGLIETARRLRSPRSAERLVAALQRALKNEGTPMAAEQLQELRQEIEGTEAAEAGAEAS